MESDIEFNLSVQRSLLGALTKSLRTVFIEVSGAKILWCCILMAWRLSISNGKNYISL